MDTKVFYEVRFEPIFDLREIEILRHTHRVLNAIGEMSFRLVGTITVAGIALAYFTSNFLLMWILFAALFLLITTYLVRVLFPKVPGLLFDLRERKKEIIYGEIKKMNVSKQEAAAEYYLLLKGRKEKIYIPATSWETLREGDRVEIHRGLHSKIVLNVIHLYQPVQESPEE